MSMLKDPVEKRTIRVRARLDASVTACLHTFTKIALDAGMKGAVKF